jgi:Ca2+-binding EF-hand superfamily protein
LVFMSAYISLLILTFYPYMFHKTSAIEFFTFIIVSIVPFVFLLTYLRQSAANMTIVCNIGVHRKPQTIAQVIREEKTDRVIRSVILMKKLQHAAESPEEFNYEEAAPTSSLCISQKIELENAKKRFMAIDKSGDGKLDMAEIHNLMESVGASTTAESLQATIEVLDINHDGSVTLDEFLTFYRNNIIPKEDLADHELHHLAHEIFTQFDTDKSRSITLSEFKAAIESFGVSFTIDEFGQLVNEIDHDNTGSIGEHEFATLLTNHRHLFQTYHLPPME